MIGRDPKWIAAQTGHTSPAFTFSVYQQAATRRFIDEQAVWTLMRFADEPAERALSRQIACRWRRRPRIDRRREGRVRPGARAADRHRQGRRRKRMTAVNSPVASDSAAAPQFADTD